MLLTAGVWTRSLGAQLGLSIPLEGAKGYCLELDALAGNPAMPVYMHEAHVVATPYPGRLRLAGTLELSGLDDSVDAVRTRAMREAAKRVLGGLDGRLHDTGVARLPTHTARRIAAHRLVSAPTTNVIVATGHATSGIVLAPVTAKLVGELYSGQPSSYDLDPMDPNRFTPRRQSRAA